MDGGVDAPSSAALPADAAAKPLDDQPSESPDAGAPSTQNPSEEVPARVPMFLDDSFGPSEQEPNGAEVSLDGQEKYFEISV